MAAKRPIITLLTDFGHQDHFVGTMKGVIANINPEASVIDITHDVAPHDIFQAAFLIKSVYQYFPSSTIHVIVVDSHDCPRQMRHSSRAIAAQTLQYLSHSSVRR